MSNIKKPPVKIIHGLDLAFRKKPEGLAEFLQSMGYRIGEVRPDPGNILINAFDFFDNKICNTRVEVDYWEGITKNDYMSNLVPDMVAGASVYLLPSLRS